MSAHSDIQVGERVARGQLPLTDVGKIVNHPTDRPLVIIIDDAENAILHRLHHTRHHG
jgi:hypothetical protein